MKKISIVGAPMWLGQNYFGSNLGPEAIRAAGLLDKLHEISDNIVDLGNIAVSIHEEKTMTCVENCKIKNLESVQNALEILAESVSDIVSARRFPLVLGGDHSVAIGTLAGVAKHYHNLGVIWCDAHADSNTDKLSPSGNIHGMSMAASLGMGNPALVKVGGYKHKIKPEHVVFIGLRDMDTAEEKLVKGLPVKIYRVEDVAEKGIERVMDETVKYLSAKCDGIHLSFDLDVMDPREICGVGTPVENGIGFHTMQKAMQNLAGCAKLTSAEFVELNPLLDHGGATVMAALTLIRALFK